MSIKTKKIALTWLSIALASVLLSLFAFGALKLRASHIEPGTSHLSCFNCHDGSVSGAVDLKSSFEKVSHHPYESLDSTSTCGSCHNSAGIKDPEGVVYPKLLQSFSSTGTAAYYGNQFCGSCHGFGSTQVGGDHLTTFAGGRHDTETTGTGSGTGIKCVSCHDQHGSDIRPMIRETINSRSPSGNNNSVCYSCHTSTLGSFAGEAEFLDAPHGSETDARNKWPIDSEVGLTSGGPQTGRCANCHNVHGKSDGSGSVYPKYNLRKEETLCYGAGQGCHSQPNSIDDIDIRQKFTASSDNRAHHNITDADQAATGGRVECVNCHNAHTNTPTEKIADPDAIAANFTELVVDATLYPTAGLQPGPEGKDSQLWSWISGSAGGTSGTLVIGKKWGAAARALIEFDVSGVPSDAAVSSATLRLPAAGSSGNVTVEAYRNLVGWSEASTDVTNAPSFAAVAAGSNVVDATGWRSLDLTGVVQGWVNGTHPNYGLTLKAPFAVELGPTDAWRAYYSSDHTYNPPKATTGRPKLVIAYTTSLVPEKADHVAFCGKCHDGTPPAGVNIPAGIRAILANYTDFGAQGDLHGARPSSGPASASPNSFKDELEGPYYFGFPALMCSDCHDTHGSSNNFALRESINARNDLSVPFSPSASNYSQIQKFCSGCHSFTHAPNPNCFLCHYHGANYDRLNGVPGKKQAYF